MITKLFEKPNFAVKLLPLSPLNDIAEGVKKLVEVGEEPMLLLCHGGKHYLIEAHCPHMGARLDGGKLNQGLIQCQHHLYKFDLSSGECATRGAPCAKLRTWPLVIEDGWLKVNAELLGQDG